jgi:hypothetical protein
MSIVRSRFGLAVLLASSLLSIAAAAPAQMPSGDPWKAIHFMTGQWRGTAEGEPGQGTVERIYEFILGGRYLHERNVSTYAGKDGGPGEVHEHWSIFSYDRSRKALILRQFHEEGFVNRYAMLPDSTSEGKIIFESLDFENFDNRWKARETYEIASPDEFIETFELAPPGKPYEVYSRNRFQRVK